MTETVAQYVQRLKDEENLMETTSTSFQSIVKGALKQ